MTEIQESYGKVEEFIALWYTKIQNINKLFKNQAVNTRTFEAIFENQQTYFVWEQNGHRINIVYGCLLYDEEWVDYDYWKFMKLMMHGVFHGFKGFTLSNHLFSRIC